MTSLIKSNTRTELEGDINVGRGQLGYGVHGTIGAGPVDLWSVYQGANSYIIDPTEATTLTLPPIGLTSVEAQPGHKILIYNDDANNSFDIAIQDPSLVTLNTLMPGKGAIYIADSASPFTWKVLIDGSAAPILTTLQQAYEVNSNNGVTLNSINQTLGEFDIIAPDLTADPLREFLSVYSTGPNTAEAYLRVGNTDQPLFEPYVRLNNAVHDPSVAGAFSLASGNGVDATGANSIALGSNGTLASGPSSFAVGDNSVVFGNTSVAIGGGIAISGDQSFAAGSSIVISGNQSNVIGSGDIDSNNSLLLGIGSIQSGANNNTLMGFQSTGSYAVPTGRTSSLSQVYNNGQYDFSGVYAYEVNTLAPLATSFTSDPAIFTRGDKVLNLVPGSTNPVIILDDADFNRQLIQGANYVTVTVVGMSQSGLGGGVSPPGVVFTAIGEIKALVQVFDNGVPAESIVSYVQKYKNVSEAPTLLNLPIVNFDLSMVVNTAPYNLQLNIVVPNDALNTVTTMSFNYHVKVEHCFTY